MRSLPLILGLLLAGGLGLTPTWIEPTAEPLGNYVGTTACAGCHEAAVSAWQQTRHAHAYESLKKSAQEGLPECLRCHVTGYEQPGGFVDLELTPELRDVQCEQCHGPRKAHVESAGAGVGSAVTPTETACRQCHTAGQDKSFDYTKKSKLVHATRASLETRP